MKLIRLLKGELAGETIDWVKKNIISVEQATAICRLYGMEYGKKQSRAYAVLTTLGFLFVGLALIVLISHNWEELPRGLRMGGLLLLTLATNGIAFKHYLAGRCGSATGFFFLGNLFYGASIFLIAQTYHLGEHYPDGIFWWALGSLPFAVLLLSPWLMIISLSLALLWFLLEWSLEYLPLSFPLFLIAGVYVLLKGRQSLALFLLFIISCLLWLEYMAFPSNRDLHAEHFALVIALFIFAYAVSDWLSQLADSRAQDYGALLSLWALRFAFIVMLVFSFETPWKELIKAQWDYQERMWFFVISLTMVSLWLSWQNKKLPLLLPFVSLFFLSLASITFIGGIDQYTIYFKVGGNFALLSMGVVLIWRAFHNNLSHYFYFGVFIILLVAFIRYVDIIGDYISAAGLFLAFAILLLAAAKFWKKYEKLES